MKISGRAYLRIVGTPCDVLGQGQRIPSIPWRSNTSIVSVRKEDGTWCRIALTARLVSEVPAAGPSTGFLDRALSMEIREQSDMPRVAVNFSWTGE